MPVSSAIRDIVTDASPCSASIYIGLAERARDLVIERVKKKTSVAELTRSMAYHPEVQHTIAEIVIELYRDVRCGRFMPANAMATHEIVGKSALGVLGEPGLRWG